MSHTQSAKVLRRALLRPGLALFLAAALPSGALIQAQEANALLDKLVQKGILSQKEGDEVRSEMQQEYSASSAGKINLSKSVTQLNIYGDLRLRWQHDDSTPVVTNSGLASTDRDRLRYRFRLNMDVQLGPSWFFGLQLQTGQTPDSGNQTYSSDFNNDNIYISRALLGWQNEWLRIVGGKQPNPFYTTDLLWDPDINPAGFTERISFNKLPLFGGSRTNGKSANPWDVSLIGGQFILGDNGRRLGNDPWIFQEQLVTKYNFNKDASITLAPGFLAETSAHVTGALNTLPFSDENAIISGTTAVQTTVQEQDVVTITYDAKGVPTKTVTPTRQTTTTQTTITPNNQTVGSATVSSPRTVTSTANLTGKGGAYSVTGRASGIPTDPTKANQTFSTTTTSQTQSVSTTNNVVMPAVGSESRALHLLNVPGDISFTLGGLRSRVYWDLVYNFSGEERFNNVYQMKEFGNRSYKPRDAFAWMTGVEFGQIRKAGDWQIFGNYREIGLASVDPNINDNEVSGSALNMRGFKFGLAYAITDFVVLQGTEYIYWSLDSGLAGGRATSVGGIAPYKSYNETTVELNIKF